MTQRVTLSLVSSHLSNWLSLKFSSFWSSTWWTLETPHFPPWVCKISVLDPSCHPVQGRVGFFCYLTEKTKFFEVWVVQKCLLVFHWLMSFPEPVTVVRRIECHWLIPLELGVSYLTKKLRGCFSVLLLEGGVWMLGSKTICKIIVYF